MKNKNMRELEKLWAEKQKKAAKAAATAPKTKTITKGGQPSAPKAGETAGKA